MSSEKTNIYVKEISTLQLDDNLLFRLVKNHVPVQLHLLWARILKQPTRSIPSCESLSFNFL